MPGTVTDLTPRCNTRSMQVRDPCSCPDADLRMRIAIVTETWPPEINGVALTVQSLARGLAALGHAVELVRPQQNTVPDPASSEEFDQLLLPGAALPRY